MVIRLYDRNNSQRDIDRIIDVLNNGGTIIYPTDTAYAIGCHALKERPIEKICRIKGLNPGKHRFSIICYDLSDISQYVRVDNATFKLMKRNLPGPISFAFSTIGIIMWYSLEGSSSKSIFSKRCSIRSEDELHHEYIYIS